VTRAGPRARRIALTALAVCLASALACAHAGYPAVQEGLASYYGDGFAGRKTASGERYDPDEFTAAHRSLPFGSVVRVARLDGGRPGSSVEVRINDRGPFVRGRIIDLSDAAARELDLLHDGVGRVSVQLVALP
jgi:rare lipoprotein A